MDDANPRRRRRRRALVALLLAAAALWIARRPLLIALGGALVAEDPLAPVDAMFVSSASARADALEAARLYRDGIAPRLVLAQWIREPIDADIERLGVPYLPVTALARAILERSGVPAAAITVLPGAATGTEDEVAAAVTWVPDAGIGSLVWIGPRTHTARTRWLLRRRLPSSVHVAVRSAAGDDFSVDGWWRSRDQSREVMSECLRWLNTAVFRDAWRPATPPS